MSKATINLHKKYKRIAGTIMDKDARRQYLDLMISAEISLLSSKNRKFSDPASSQKSKD